MANKTPLYVALVFSLGLAACDACNPYKLKPVERSGGVQTKKELVIPTKSLAEKVQETWNSDGHIPNNYISAKTSLPRFAKPIKGERGKVSCPDTYWLLGNDFYDKTKKKYTTKWICERYDEKDFNDWTNRRLASEKRDRYKGIGGVY